MAQKKRKPLMSPEERAEYQRQFDERTELLEERLAYGQARRIEEQELRDREERRRAELAEFGFFGRLGRRLAA